MPILINDPYPREIGQCTECDGDVSTMKGSIPRHTDVRECMAHLKTRIEELEKWVIGSARKPA